MKTDDQIIRNIIAGEQHAFRVLVNEYQDMVFTMCFRVIRDREVAEEAAQDVFIKVFRKLHLFDQRSSLKTWIYRIAYRTAIDHQRKKRPVTAEVDKLSLASGIENAHQNMERSEEQEHLHRAIGTLKSIDSTLISLYYMDELKIEEIAKITKLTESNIKVRLHRARHQLEKILSQSKNINA